MAEFEGTIANMSRDREGRVTVLRFSLDVPDLSETLPVEMRGGTISGVVNDGDVVSLAAKRGRDGVARPRRVRNLSNSSDIRARGSGIVGTALRGLVSVAFSIAVATAAGYAADVATGDTSSRGGGGPSIIRGPQQVVDAPIAMFRAVAPGVSMRSSSSRSADNDPLILVVTLLSGLAVLPIIWILLRRLWR